jgi:hypothetical protein
MVEAGGVEPPSERGCRQKTTCLSDSIGFAASAQNRQETPTTSPVNLAVRSRAETERPARCATPHPRPTGKAWGDGLAFN